MIRGAVDIKEDTPAAIRDGVEKLLKAISDEVTLLPECIRTFIVTSTRDIRSAYPCAFIRRSGYERTPLLCVQEMDVEGALPMTIRFLIQMDGEDSNHFVYLGGAAGLRDD